MSSGRSQDQCWLTISFQDFLWDSSRNSWLKQVPYLIPHTIQMSDQAAWPGQHSDHRAPLPRAQDIIMTANLLELEWLRLVVHLWTLIDVLWPGVFFIAHVHSTHYVCTPVISSDGSMMCECNVILSWVSSQGRVSSRVWSPLATIHIWAESRSWHASYDKLLLAPCVLGPNPLTWVSHGRVRMRGPDKTWTGYWLPVAWTGLGQDLRCARGYIVTYWLSLAMLHMLQPGNPTISQHVTWK